MSFIGFGEGDPAASLRHRILLVRSENPRRHQAENPLIQPVQGTGACTVGSLPGLGTVEQPMKMLIASSAMLVVVATGMAVAQAQMEEQSTTPLTQVERVTTPDFINKVWNTNTFEVQAGQEAKKRAKGAAYLDYAQMIVADHARMNEELKAILQNMRVEFPTKLDNEHQVKLQALRARLEIHG